jgi:hypothetical protein
VVLLVDDAGMSTVEYSNVSVYISNDSVFQLSRSSHNRAVQCFGKATSAWYDL